MAGKKGRGRQFTEKDVARILRRAAEMQSGQGETSDAADGLSRDEIERIGAEVGLEQRHMLAAIEEHESRGFEDTQTRWLGAPEEYEIERIVEGELTEEAWQSLVGELNANYKQSIEGVSSGKVHTWNWKGDLGFVHFTAVKGKNSTRLKLTCHIDDGIIVALLPSIVLMLVAVGSIMGIGELATWAKPILAVAAAGLIAWTFRRSVSRWYRNDRVRSADLMERLEAVFTPSLSSRLEFLPAKESEEPRTVRVDEEA